MLLARFPHACYRPRMHLRRAFSAACAFFVLGGAALGGCSTDAVGIEACRTIQMARCEVAPTCLGEQGFTIETEEQVENCKTYYIDGCLVGVENPGVEDNPPDDADTTGKECEEAIRALGACKTAGESDLASDCKAAGLRDGEDAATTLCMALDRPEVLKKCAWLEKPEDDEE